MKGKEGRLHRVIGRAVPRKVVEVYRGRTKSKKLEQALRSGVRSRYTDLKGATEGRHSSC